MEVAYKVKNGPLQEIYNLCVCSIFIILPEAGNEAGNKTIAELEHKTSLVRSLLWSRMHGVCVTGKKPCPKAKSILIKACIFTSSTLPTDQCKPFLYHV